MGRRNARRNKSKNQDYNQQSGERQSYEPIKRENEAFENYYKAQRIVGEDEWQDFMMKLRAPLPSTFRITGNRSQAKELLKIIKSDYVANLTKAPPGVNTDNGRTYSPPKSLPWYPDEMAWQLDFDRRFIRQSATLKKLHQFLISETESGNISRQEAVSMLPPLLLDVQPHHKVLDMCAAPGSKTSQLIEMLHANNSQDSCIPSGFVVANDNDNKRCYLMVHQVKRLESPNFLIINHDAANLPNIRVTPLSDVKTMLRYDRILADVPCTGDGTLRKNPDVWLKWNSAAGHNLHPLQISILKRGLELLEVGGRLVYSTCSFNPIENEAVIASCLRMSEGAVELLDNGCELPGFKFNKGLTDWKVISRVGDFYENCDNLPANLRTQIRESMFPPPPDVAASMKLERCVRVLPHHQNTGGFFVATMRKTRQVPWLKTEASPKPAETQHKDVKAEVVPPTPAGGSTAATDVAQKGGDVKLEDAGVVGGDDVAAKAAKGKDEEAEIEVKVDESGATKEAPQNGRGQKRREEFKRDGSPPPLKRQHLKGYKEDPFVFLTEDEAIWPPIREFYGVNPTFPVTQLLVRCNVGKKRNLYFVSAAVKRLVEFNKETIRFINLGLKVFGRSECVHVKCDFRLAQDGINTLSPFLKSRRVPILLDDIVVILNQENPFLSKLTAETQGRLEALDQGSLLFLYEPEEGKPGPACRLVISGWLGRTSCRSFLPRHERAHYLRLCGEELRSKEEVDAEKAAKALERDAKRKETEGGLEAGGDGEKDGMAAEAEEEEEGKRKETEGGLEAGGDGEKDGTAAEAEEEEKEEVEEEGKEQGCSGKEEEEAKPDGMDEELAGRIMDGITDELDGGSEGH